MKEENNIIKFSDKTINIVKDINAQLLAKRTLMTDPEYLFLQCYDSFNLETGEPPIDSKCRYTLDCLNYIFPLVKFSINEDNMILIEGNLTEYSAIPNRDSHIEYIKEIMLDIIPLYQDDETKMPKEMYRWYFEKK